MLQLMTMMEGPCLSLAIVVLAFTVVHGYPTHAATSSNQESIFVRLFHGLPHSPLSEDYLRSLIVLGSLSSVLVSLLQLLIALYMLRTLQNNSEGRLTPFSSSSSLAILSLGSILGLFLSGIANEILHTAIHNAGSTAGQLGSLFTTSNELSKELFAQLDAILKKRVERFLDRPLIDASLRPEVFHRVQGSIKAFVSDYMFGELVNASNVLSKVRWPLVEGELDSSLWLERYQRMDWVRWMGTLTLLILLIIFASLLFFCWMTRSRRVLLLFTGITIFSMISGLILTSLYFMAAIAISDFCSDPLNWIQSSLEGQIPVNVTAYYLECPGNAPHPYKGPLLKALQSLRVIEDHIKDAAVINSHSQIFSSYLNEESLAEDMDKAEFLLDRLIKNSGCGKVGGLYEVTLEAVCYQGFPGILLMLSSAWFLVSLFLGLTWVCVLTVVDHPVDQGEPGEHPRKDLPMMILNQEFNKEKNNINSRISKSSLVKLLQVKKSDGLLFIKSLPSSQHQTYSACQWNHSQADIYLPMSARKKHHHHRFLPFNGLERFQVIPEEDTECLMESDSEELESKSYNP